MSLTYFEAKAADGRRVLEWLEATGYFPEKPETYDPAMARNFRKWRNGAYPPVETVDHVCILLGVSWFELPDDVWVREVPNVFPPRSCHVCGVDMPRRRRIRTNQPDSWETYNEYVASTTCSPKCGNKKAARSRKEREAA